MECTETGEFQLPIAVHGSWFQTGPQSLILKILNEQQTPTRGAPGITITPFCTIQWVRWGFCESIKGLTPPSINNDPKLAALFSFSDYFSLPSFTRIILERYQQRTNGGREKIEVQENMCLLRKLFRQESQLSRGCCWVGKRTGNI